MTQILSFSKCMFTGHRSLQSQADDDDRILPKGLWTSFGCQAKLANIDINISSSLQKKSRFYYVLNLTLSCCSYFLEKSHQVSWHGSQAEDELKLRMAKAAAGPLSFYSFLASLETGNLECFTWFKLQSQREIFSEIWYLHILMSLWGS